MNTTLAHSLFLAVTVICYTVLTATGHDANVLIGLAVGQGVGAGIQKAGET